MQEERRRRTWEAPEAPGRRERRQQGQQLLRHSRGHPDTGRCGHRNDRTEPGARQAEEDGERERPPDALGESYHAEDSERGNATDQGKGVTEGRSPHRACPGPRITSGAGFDPGTRAPDTVGADARKPTSPGSSPGQALRGIADKANADTPHRCRDLYRCLNVELLLECWGDPGSSPGQALKKDAAGGVDGVTWQAYAEHLQANVEAVGERLKQKRYRAKLMRRRYMPKGNGHERP